MKSSLTVKVPGKIMLAGEYAVLRGGASMGCTVSSFMNIKAERLTDRDDFEAYSDLWGQKQSLKDARGSKEPLIDLLHHLSLDSTNTPVRLSVCAKLKTSYGIGSSSALRFGGLLAARELYKGSELAMTDRWDVAREAFDLQRKAQMHASGYDIATQCVGGLTVMRSPHGADQWPGLIAHISSGAARLNNYVLPMVGSKGAGTTELVQNNVRWLDEHRQWDHLFQVSENLFDALTSLLTSSDPKSKLSSVIDAVIRHREFFADSPAGENSLIPILRGIAGFDKDWTCKTTGAGGDDAVLLIGERLAIETVRDQLQASDWHPAPFSFVEEAAHTATECEL